MNITMGDTWARGDLNTVKMHFAPTQNGVGADLSFRRCRSTHKIWRPWYVVFRPIADTISATNDPMPFAKIHGNLTYGGQSHSVKGTGT